MIMDGKRYLRVGECALTELPTMADKRVRDHAKIYP